MSFDNVMSLFRVTNADSILKHHKLVPVDCVTFYLKQSETSVLPILQLKTLCREDLNKDCLHPKTNVTLR
jgi:hypothetical protein